MTPTIEEKVDFVRYKVIEAHGGYFGKDDSQQPASKRVFEIDVKDDPIRLADILLAIEYSRFKGTIKFSTYGDKFHIGVYEKPNREGYYSKAYYNLLNDNFDHQTNKTKEFIWEILK